MKKAAEILDSGVETDMLSFHRYFSGLNNEELKSARIFRRIETIKGFALAGLIIGGFTVFVQVKNKHRFDK